MPEVRTGRHAVSLPVVTTSAQALERGAEAAEIVRALKGYGLNQQEIAAITGVSDRAVRQWRRAGIRPDRYDRLGEVREIVLLLSDSLSPRGVGQWLHAKNRLLHSERAIELLTDARVSEVRATVRAFVEGAYV